MESTPSTIINIDSELVADARATAENTGRSVEQQLELWIRFGRLLSKVCSNDQQIGLSGLANLERVVREWQIREILRHLFASEDAITTWLQTADPSLGMKSPLELLDTDAGAAKVTNLARSMVHGVPL